MAVPVTVNDTVSAAAVEPVRVMVKVPASGPVSEAVASDAAMEMTGVLVSAIVTVTAVAVPTV